MFEETTKGNCGCGALTSNERIFWCMGVTIQDCIRRC